IVLAWVAGAAAAMALLPSLSSVTQSDNTSFLPASAPSQQAARLASPLQGATLTAVTVVGARSGGTLTGTDEAFVGRLTGSLTRIPRVVSVRDAGQSAGGQAEKLTVLAALAQSGGLAASQQVSAGAAGGGAARGGGGAGGRAANRRGRGGRPGRVPDRLAAADRAGARGGHGLRAVPDVPGAGGDAGRATLPRGDRAFGGAGR